MKLEEAIEIVDDVKDLSFLKGDQKAIDACKILIEAGKRIQEYRKVVCTPVGSQLPGETK